MPADWSPPELNAECVLNNPMGHAFSWKNFTQGPPLRLLQVSNGKDPLSRSHTHTLAGRQLDVSRDARTRRTADELASHLGDGSLREVIHWPELKTLDDFHRIRGGNPVLFPFNGRTFDVGQIGLWRDAEGTRRPMPMHGFARQGEFKTTRMDARGFSAVLVPSEEAKEAYPFAYEFTVAYRFAPLGLSCEFTLQNLDTRPIPWSAGHHFYFTVPWSEAHARTDYAIRIPASRTLRQDAVGKLAPGPVLNPEERLLDNDALVDTFHVGLKSNAVVFGPKSAPGQVTIKHGTAAAPPPDATFVTWTSNADALFFCVEPWMGPPNASETKVGLHWVQPGQTQSFVVDIAVK